MKIKIEHIAKIEGHAGFVAHIVNGDVKKAKFEIKQGKRFMEKLLEGRKYDEVPIICSRICGICPVVHQITSIRAIEDAFGIKPNQEIRNLRKIMLALQIIQSHTLHLFLIWPDKRILPIRDFVNNLLNIIGGRSIHPITLEVGGFKRIPNQKEIEKLMKEHGKILKSAIKIASQFKKQPEFLRKTGYFASSDIYDGKLPKKNNKTIMLGALARINLYSNKLNPHAKKLLHFKIPSYNSFMNIPSQAIEIVHFLEEVKKISEKLKYKNVSLDYKVKAGKGTAFCEAPRGILFHSYSIDSKGYIKKADIITPTLQFISNLEADIKEYLKGTQDKEKIKRLIRAYDPCISCAIR